MKKELKKSLTVLASDVLRITYDANEKRIKSRLSDAQFRKVRKLANNPELFVKDVITKKKEQARKYLPIKYDGNFNYTVVSAVYNVEKYLDEYFESLVNQSLDFKKHIHLILVDDGSTDNSAQIIKKWQKKYPKNIHYYYKENGGQASARNLGLQYVETEWVTFIDPDDFVDADYFKNTDDIIAQNKDLKMVVANIKFYFESTGAVKDGHPLKYRFNDEPLCLALELKNKLILSAATVFFHAEAITNNGLVFDDRIKPSFEDAKFVADYLLAINAYNVYFGKKLVYFYRKRGDGSSTLDTAWENIGKFDSELRYGLLPMLASYKNAFGVVPTQVQRTALYHIIWYLKQLINRDERIGFLTDEQKSNFATYIEQIFQYIDTKTILDFELAGVWFLQKVGMIETFKKEKIPLQLAYVEKVDREKKQILVYFFSGQKSLFSFQLNGRDIVPNHYKNTIHTFNENTFVLENRFWIPFESEADVLTLNIENKNSRIACGGKHHTKGLVLSTALKAFAFSEQYRHNDSWLIMDRDVQADDNAEHLYRYIKNTYPEQVCYFALNRNSHDWERLVEEGFDLVEYGTIDFEIKLRRASKIISSHLDNYISNYFGDEYEYSKKLVFLQHGITKDNQSHWFNTKKILHCLITATFDEYHSIADNNNTYRLTDKETVLTGFPRHDSLLNNNQSNSKVIAIMPTWRRNIMGEVIGDGNTRELNSQFMQTDYAQHWYNFLHSPMLKALSEQYGYQVIFAPHANIAPYLLEFKVPSYIEIWDSKTSNESMQSLFQRSKLMITDYSSVAFELAYLGKTVLYYQFDKDELYSGGHIYQQGYFDYEKHGFGAVLYQENELLVALEQVLQNNGEPVEPYATRIRETFPFRDGKCCERVYRAIKALDEPEENTINLKILREMIESAYRHQDWKLLIERAEKFLANKSDDLEVQLLFIQALTQTKQWRKAQEAIELYAPKGADKFALPVAFANYDWQGVVSTYQNVEPSFKLSYQYLQALIKLDNKLEAMRVVNQLLQGELSENERLAVLLTLLDLQGQYESVLELSDKVALIDTKELSVLKPQLLLAKAHRLLGNHDLAHAQLVAFEQHTKDDVDCRLEIAKLAFAREQYGKCIAQFERLISINYPLTATEQKLYLDAVFLAGQYEKYVALFDNVGSDTDNQVEYKIVANNQAFRVAYIHQDWQAMTSHHSESDANFIDTLLYVQALQKLDQPQKAKAQLKAIQNDELTDSEQLLVNLLLLDVDEKYQEVAELTEQLEGLSILQKKLFKPQLLLAKAHRLLGNHDLAHAQLVAFEQHTKDDVDCRLEIAKLAFAREQYGKCIAQFERLISINYPLTATEQKLYLDAVFLAGQYEKYVALFDNVGSDTDNQVEYKIVANNQAFRVAYIHQDWQAMTSHHSESDANFIDTLLYVQALQKLDQPQKAKAQLKAIQNDELTDSEQLLVNLLLLDVDEKYQEVAELTEQLEGLSILQKKLFKPQLLLAKAHRLLGNHDLAHAQLVAFEQHTKDDVDCRLEIAKLAFAREQYGKCIAQFERLISINYPLTATEQKLYLDAVFLAGQYEKYVALFDNVGSDTDNQVEYKIVANNQAFRVAYIHQDWQAMTSHHSESDANFIDTLLYVQALQKLDQPQKAKAQLKAIQNDELTDSEQLLVNLLLLDVDEKYQEVAELTEQLEGLSILQKKLFKPQLLLAKAHRLLGNHDLAHAQLVAFEQHTKDDVDCRLEIAKLSYAQENYSKVLIQLNKAYENIWLADDDVQFIYIKSMCGVGNYAGFLDFVGQYQGDNVDLLRSDIIRSLVFEKRWQSLDIMFNKDPKLKEVMVYEYAMTQYRMGRFEGLDKKLPKPIFGHPYKYWQLMVEIAEINENVELQKYCYKGMISIFPDVERDINKDSLFNLCSQ